MAGQAFFGDLLLDHGLCRDARVVGAGQDERREAAHPVPAAQGVLDRVVERVAHVQAAGDVGRRDGDAVLGLARRRLGVKITVRLPLLVQTCLDPLRLVSLFHA